MAGKVEGKVAFITGAARERYGVAAPLPARRTGDEGHLALDLSCHWDVHSLRVCIRYTNVQVTRTVQYTRTAVVGM
ncbi:hypothetical protein MAHJHV63_54380 [Mycobacterium avium subsp. hominissuis]